MSPRPHDTSGPSTDQAGASETRSREPLPPGPRTIRKDREAFLVAGADLVAEAGSAFVILACDGLGELLAEGLLDREALADLVLQGGELLDQRLVEGLGQVMLGGPV